MSESSNYLDTVYGALLNERGACAATSKNAKLQYIQRSGCEQAFTGYPGWEAENAWCGTASVHMGETVMGEV